MARPRTAMVLAAGFGKRMLPLSQTVPKPLVRVGGCALIDRCLDGLAAAGIATAVVNVHHLADRLEAHLAGRTSPKILISDERGLLLETGGGIRKALPLLGPEPFLLRNSDSFWVESGPGTLESLIAAWDPDRMDCLLLLASATTSVGYAGRGDFLLEPEGRLQRRPEGGTAPFVYAGAAIVHPRLFTGAPEGAFSLNLLFDRAIAAGRLWGTRLDGLWVSVETPAAIGLAEQALAASAA